MTHEYEMDYLIIPMEDGTEEKYEILFTFDHDETGRKYMIVIPSGTSEEEVEKAEALAFRYTEDEEGSLNLESIDDDKEWEIVEDIYNTLLAKFSE